MSIKPPLRISVAIIAFASLSVAAGCVATHDSVADMTYTDLAILGEVVTKFSWDECNNVGSMQHLYDIAKRKGLMEPGLASDGWGNPYNLRIQKTDAEIVFLVTSGGPNGRYENGRGDHMSCEIRIAKSGENSYQRFRN